MWPLQIHDAVWVRGDLYVGRQEAIAPLLAEVKRLGYAVGEFRGVRYGREKGLYTCDLKRGECLLCPAYISLEGAGTHGHTCERCSGVISWEMRAGTLMHFFLREPGKAVQDAALMIPH